MTGALLMGKHDAPGQAWTPVFTGYQCERCKGFWASVQLDEGVIPEGLFCLATEGCGGLVVALMPTEEPAPDWMPVIYEYFKPKANIRYVHYQHINDHIRGGGLLTRPTPIAPDWVKARLGFIGGLRTF